MAGIAFCIGFDSIFQNGPVVLPAPCNVIPGSKMQSEVNLIGFQVSGHWMYSARWVSNHGFPKWQEQPELETNPLEGSCTTALIGQSHQPTQPGTEPLLMLNLAAAQSKSSP